MLASAPTTSVVVPTRGRPAWLDRLLRALRMQEDAPPFEVVVVVDGPDAETLSVVRSHADADARVRHVVLERSRGPGPARNSGWQVAAGQVVAFVDDDCVPAEDWLHRISAPILSGNADVVQGTTKALGPRLPRDRWVRQIVITRPSGRFETCNIAYRAALLARLGGFDEALSRAGEDADLGRRAMAAGARFAFLDGAVVEHQRVTEHFRGLLASRARAVDLPGLVKRHPEVRRDLFAGIFWDRRHATTWAGLAGAALVASRARWALPLIAGVAIALRRRHYPDASVPRGAMLAAGSRAADVWEVMHTARGAARARTLVL